MTIFLSEFQPTTKKCSFILNILLIFIGIAFIIKAFILPSTIKEQTANIIFGCFFLFIYFYFLWTIPIYIELDKNVLRIKRRFTDKCIPYCLIKDSFMYNEAQGDIRHFGSNGFMGYFGIMENTVYGKYHSYVKNPKEQVFIITNNKNYLISCNNRELFIEELKKRTQ